MKIENLSVNQRIKNYKELCNILGIEVKNGGASKKAQLKELERFVRYEKDKNSFIIKEIYKQPIEAVSKGGNNRKNLEISEKVMIHLLMDGIVTGQREMIIPKSSMMKRLGYINDNYHVAMQNKNKTLAYLEIGNNTYDYFMNSQYNKITKSIERTLKAIQRKRLIFFEYVRCIGIEDTEGNIFSRPATEEERTNILLIESQVLKGFGYNDIGSIFATNQTHEYYKRVNMVLKSKFNISFSFMAYRITMHDDFINEIISEYNLLLDNGMTKNKLRLKLNEVSENSNLKTFKKAHNKVVEMLESEEVKNKFEVDKLITRSSDNFIEDGKTLFNCLCSLNCKDNLNDILEERERYNEEMLKQIDTLIDDFMI